MANDFIIKENVRKEKQHFFLNTTEIPGIQNLQVSYEQNLKPLVFAGMGNPVMVPDGPQKGNVSLSYLVISGDSFLQHTGLGLFNSYIIRARDSTAQNVSMISGALTSYRSSCKIGEIPAIDINYSVFGNIGKLTAEDEYQLFLDFAVIAAQSTNYNYQIAFYGSIDLNINEFSTNRVLSYDLSLNIERNAIYPLGTRTPTQVEINWPIEVVCGVEYAVNDYPVYKLHNVPTGYKNQNLELILKSYNLDQTIIAYRFSGLSLVSEVYNTNVDGMSTVQAIYKGYLGRPG